MLEISHFFRDGGLAEEIFISIENPTAETYTTLIQGMTKYFQVERAWELFQEAQQKNLTLSIEAYNSLIRVCNFIKESFQMRLDFTMDMLTLIKQAKLKPNLGTLNAVLEILSYCGTSDLTKQKVLQTLVEFRNIGIEPSLGSWYFVLITYCKESK